jgi:hypothetical protein
MPNLTLLRARNLLKKGYKGFPSRINICTVEITYGINSVISKLMTFVKNAETGKFLFFMVLILSCFTCS